MPLLATMSQFQTVLLKSQLTTLYENPIFHHRVLSKPNFLVLKGLFILGLLYLVVFKIRRINSMLLPYCIYNTNVVISTISLSGPKKASSVIMSSLNPSCLVLNPTPCTLAPKCHTIHWWYLPKGVFDTMRKIMLGWG